MVDCAICSSSRALDFFLFRRYRIMMLALQSVKTSAFPNVLPLFLFLCLSLSLLKLWRSLFRTTGLRLLPFLLSRFRSVSRISLSSLLCLSGCMAGCLAGCPSARLSPKLFCFMHAVGFVNIWTGVECWTEFWRPRWSLLLFLFHFDRMSSFVSCRIFSIG